MVPLVQRHTRTSSVLDAASFSLRRPLPDRSGEMQPASGKLPAQVEPVQVSPSVHGLPSSHEALLFAGPEQTPPLHVSDVVQGFPSSHSAPLEAGVHDEGSPVQL